METCGHQEKVASRPKVILEIFLKIQKSFYELGQQERGQGFIRYKCDPGSSYTRGSSSDPWFLIPKRLPSKDRWIAWAIL